MLGDFRVISDLHVVLLRIRSAHISHALIYVIRTPVNKRGIGRGRGNRPNRAKSPRTCAAACVSSRSAGYTAKSDHASLAPRSLSSDMVGFGVAR